jgi:hypothetical protein
MSAIKKFASVFGMGISADLDKRVLIERAHRVVLISPRDLICRLEYKGDPLQIDVLDVSESGIGFKSKDFPSESKIGEQMSAYIMAEGDAFAVRIEIIRKTAEIIGARVLGDFEAWRSFLGRHFALELEAAALLLVDPQIMTKPLTGVPWWFFSPEGKELYFVVHQDRVTSFQLAFDHHYFVGDDLGVRYGQIHFESVDDPKMKGSPRISMKNHDGPDKRAFRFLKNIERLPSEYLEQIMQLWKVSGKSQ